MERGDRDHDTGGGFFEVSSAVWEEDWSGQWALALSGAKSLLARYERARRSRATCNSQNASI